MVYKCPPDCDAIYRLPSKLSSSQISLNWLAHLRFRMLPSNHVRMKIKHLVFCPK